MKKLLLSLSAMFSMHLIAQVPQTLDVTFGDDGYAISESSAVDHMYKQINISDNDYIVQKNSWKIFEKEMDLLHPSFCTLIL